MTDKATNAGVDAQTGFALQRNTALYLLLEYYETKFKEKKYFVCIEHHDDFLFCFLNDKNEAEFIEAYQSKKKAPSTWELNSELIEIIEKLLKTGKSLIEDKIIKSNNYSHGLFFSTNQTVNLKTYEEGSRKIKESKSIKAENKLVCFSDLEESIKDKISLSITVPELKLQLTNLRFAWIGLGDTVELQEDALVGKIDRFFQSKVYNPRAALNTIIKLFNDVEYIYNQNNKADLLDIRKRVSSEKIEDTFKLLTSKSKCFGYWRSKTSEVSRILAIRPVERDTFEFAFNTAFDFFKSYEKAEHRKILEFVKQNLDNCTTYTDEETVEELVTMYSINDSTHLGTIEFKAVVFAAFYEATFKQ